MIVLHHLNNSRSQRILWMLEELGLEYEIKNYQRDSKTMFAPQSLKNIHPLGKSPVITDGKLTLAESGAVIEYLARTYGKDKLIPEEGTETHLDYIYWLHYAEGSLMPLLLTKLIFDRIKANPMPFFVKPIAHKIVDETTRQFISPQLKTHFDYVEKHLSEHEWFAGDRFSGADIQMSFPLEASLARRVAVSYSNTEEYVKRYQARAAYRKALEVGGDYAYGKRVKAG